MASALNPFRNISSSISAEEFELYCLNVLKGFAERDDLKNFSISHNQKIQAPDGIYQIDIFASFSAMGLSMKLLVECKRYSRSIERKVVTDLYARMSSLGMQKALLISTSGFQEGAVEYARIHGISLVQIIDQLVLFITNSTGYQDPALIKVKQAYQRKLPAYYAMLVDNDLDFPSEIIYPTNEMEEKAKKETINMFPNIFSKKQE